MPTRSASDIETKPETSSPPTAPQLAAAAQALAELQIRALILAHHGKTSGRDLDGFAADYAPKADYFDQGELDRQAIRADQAKYQAKWTNTIRETIRGGIRLKPIDARTYQATYELNSYVASNEDQRWVDATSDITLRVTFTGARPFITYQRSTVRNVKKGTLK